VEQTLLVIKAWDGLPRSIGPKRGICHAARPPELPEKETTMKTLQIEQLSPQLRRVEEGFAALVTVLFRAYPELLCFSLGGRSDLPPGVELGDSDAQLFITEVDFARPVSQEYQNEIGEALGGIVSDIVSERPEALEVLPGRTFARVLQ
jgi:hypothetical protein